MSHPAGAGSTPTPDRSRFHLSVTRFGLSILTAEVEADSMVLQALDTSTGKAFDLFMIEPN